MRKGLWFALALLVAAAIAAGVAIGDDGASDNKTFEYTVGLWGDLPYSAAQEAALPALIADMNRSDIEFSVHDGDLKQVGQPLRRRSVSARARLVQLARQACDLHARRQRLDGL
jgi:hypothetical protein